MKRASAIFSGSTRHSKTSSSSKASHASASQSTQSLPLHAHPPYSGPPEYKIGDQAFNEPFVTVRQLKGHLSLLGAFAELREKVDAGSMVRGQWTCSMPKDLNSRWAWFISVAVERFERWCEKLPAYNANFFVARDEVPPVEVLMVWHAYLLNPRCYADDAARHPMLHNVRREFGDRLMTYILENGKKSFSEPPRLKRSENWRRTGLSWHPFGGNQLLNKTIECPGCSRNTTVDLTNGIGTGYIQALNAKCITTSICRSRRLSKCDLGVHKLAKDLKDRSTKSYLAGTVYYTDTGRDPERAEAVKARVYAKLAEKSPLLRLETTSSSSLEAPALEALAGAVDPQRYKIITSAYKDDKPFSLDLVGAVLRQYTFIQKMRGIGWTKHGFFDEAENEFVLRHARVRYHAFLDLMSSSKTFLVPTLDIDLVWHTHQLLAVDYYNKCMTSVGRFIDHDDKVEESTLSTAFDTTRRAWRDHFGLPYTYCGCPIPGDTVGQRLSRLVLHYRESWTWQRLLTPMENRRDSRAATHPSDHNAVYELNPGSRVEVPKVGWSMKRGTKGTYREKLEREKRMMSTARMGSDKDCDYYPAFLTPVPYQDWSVAVSANNNRYSQKGLTRFAAVAARSAPVSKRSTGGARRRRNGGSRGDGGVGGGGGDGRGGDVGGGDGGGGDGGGGDSGGGDGGGGDGGGCGGGGCGGGG